MPSDTHPEVEAFITRLAHSKKYRSVGLAEDTIRDIVHTELIRQPNTKAAFQSAKKKLHEVMALYLGDPDYTQARQWLAAAFETGNTETIKTTCVDLMRAHDSTRERLPLLATFYPRIFAVTGRPQTVLDLACGLNPLAIPWMNLPDGVCFYAYDIHRQRVECVTYYLELQKLAGRGIMQDILVHPPQEAGDVAFLLKEIHRMEKRRRGIVLPLLDALAVRWVVISSPTRNRTGRRDVQAAYRQQVHAILAERPWHITEIAFESELVYCVDKMPQSAD